MSNSTYNPNGLLDAVMDKCAVKNDAALARLFEVAPPVISKVRHHKLPVGSSLMIKCHEIAGMTFPEIRRYTDGGP